MRPRKIDPAFLVGRNCSHPRLRLQLVTISFYLTAGIHLDGLKIHGGDKTAVLTGEGLKDVVSVEIDKQTFTPSGEGNDDKAMHLQADTGVSLDDGSNATAKLKDGRTIGGPINAGDVVIFHSLTVHSSKLSTSNQLRCSVDCRFQSYDEAVSPLEIVFPNQA